MLQVRVFVETPWLFALVCGGDDDSVSAEEARAVFYCIEERLALEQTAQPPSPRPQHGSLTRLPSSEGAIAGGPA
jgi:hypothetical protein